MNASAGRERLASIRTAGERELIGPQALALLAVVVLAAAGGIAVARAPLPTLALCGAFALVAGVLALGPKAPTLFVASLVVLLVGYGFLSRGFAYVGARPVYVGEVCLVIGAVAFLTVLPRARFGLVHAVIVAFMALGALRTLPYVGEFGIDALRDGVTWIYAAFAIFVSVMLTRDHLARIVRGYGWYAVLFLAWVPVSTALLYTGFVPLVPGTEVPIIGGKSGDMGVQLAGIGAFLLVGLYRSVPAARVIGESLVWIGWLLAVGFVAAMNRGAMLAMTTTTLAAFLVRPSARWIRPILIVAFLVVGALALDPKVDFGDRRVVSPTQIVANIASVFGDTGNTDLDGSRNWRLAWWGEIVGYTVDGPYFWTGKGFGINLADDDGFQVGDVGLDTSLRAPHNGHMEILARMGVPGFVLWILVQVSWLAMMIRAASRARRADDPRGAAVVGWLVAFWAAALVNMSFDVFLQGPHGGIWYWSIVGLGIAVATFIREDASAAPETDAIEASAPGGSRG